MCGLVGAWGYGAAAIDPALFQRMTAALIHRGPDDEGAHFDAQERVALGFRRLAILDTSAAGHQPMSSPDGSVWLVMNGEIYNFLELRTHLERKGHTFTSRSDTEVLIHAYLEYGQDCVRELDGMFAFALWDGRRRRLLLARDRMGEKPLFYADDGSRVLFSSEVAPLLLDRSVSGKMDRGALCDYLELGYVAGERTMFGSIRRLPPATTLSFDGGGQSRSRYWSWAPYFQAPGSSRLGDLEEEVSATFREAVRSRMVSDVPLGAFLSGGLDSSAIVAVMSSLSPTPVKTFSISFPGEPEDESLFAKAVAERFATEHHQLDLEPEDVRDVLPRVIGQFDDPFADSSAIPTYYLSKLARSFVTVVLSGDGGDEVFGGYARYQRMLRESIVLDLIPAPARVLLAKRLRWLTEAVGRGERLARRAVLDPDERYGELMRQVDTDTVETMGLAPRPDVPCGVELIVRSMRELAGKDFGSRLQYADVSTYLPDDILVKVDRMTMMTSLEARAPFLAPKLMQLAARVPGRLRIGTIGSGGSGKVILRRAMRGVLPAPILRRPKAGFGLPVNKWVRGDLNAYMSSVLLDRAWLDKGIVSREGVERVIRGSREKGDHRLPWMLVTLALWSLSHRVEA